MYHRVGHVFQGRYKAILVEKDAYLRELCRYVVLNPVRARAVKDPGRWPWSSYRAMLGEAQAPRWLAVDEVRRLDRGNGAAFKTTVYLLRRIAYLTLADVASLAGVSAPRVSQIQAEIERGQPGGRVKAVLTKYKVKP